MRNRQSTHDQCWEMLPWLVNGSLPAEQRAEVERHISECAECAHELVLQQRLHTELRDGDAVMLAPQASWQKMSERLDQEEDAQSAQLLKPSRRSKLRGGMSANFRGWQFAAAMQAIVIVGLGIALWSQLQSGRQNSAAAAPRYETLTSSVDVPIANRASGAEFRVVFQRDVPIADINQLLQGLPAQIVSGPTEAGVYLLALPPDRNQTAPALLTLLRGDRRVIFAEHLNLVEYQP